MKRLSHFGTHAEFTSYALDRSYRLGLRAGKVIAAYSSDPTNPRAIRVVCKIRSNVPESFTYNWSQPMREAFAEGRSDFLKGVK